MEKFVKYEQILNEHSVTKNVPFHTLIEKQEI
jgi:hypothetical protein